MEPKIESRSASGRFDWRAFALIFLGAVLLGLPMFIYGPYPKGHDLYEHVTYTRYFSEQFWIGEIYPRWLIGMNHGLGSPSFFVFPPFQAYVYVALQPLTGLLHLDTFAAEEFLMLLVSGICTFVWLRSEFGRLIGLFLALLYMLAPYHLEIDFYRRAAVGECWALAWTPLLLYLTARIMAGKRAAVAWFGLTFAVMITCHLISVLMVSLLPIAAALLLGEKGQRLRSLRAIVGGMVLGAGISSFYLLPALRHAKYFPAYKLVPPVSTYLISFAALFGDFAVSPFTHAVALCGANAIVVCILCGAAVLARGTAVSKKRVLFWLAAAAFPAFMMLSISVPVWGVARRLLWSIQYPFRLNVVLCLAEIAMLATLLADARWKSRASAGFRVGLLALVCIPWFLSYAKIWKLYRAEPNPREEFAHHDWGRFPDDGWFHAWTASGLDADSAMRASAGPRARFTSGTGEATVLEWTPRHIEVETNSAAGGRVMVTQFYYPFWRASLVPLGAEVTAEASAGEGFLSALVPAGPTRIRFDLRDGRAEQAGPAISFASILVFGVQLWRGRVAKRPKPPSGETV